MDDIKDSGKLKELRAFTIGLFYRKNESYSVSVDFFKVSATQGHVSSLYLLDMSYYHDNYLLHGLYENLDDIWGLHDVGVEKDMDLNIEYEQEPWDWLLYDVVYHMDDHSEHSYDMLISAIDEADAGCVDSIREVYQRYLIGYGVKESPSDAFYWCTEAAKRGLDSAKYDLGVMYSRGHGVEKSLSKAFYWFKEAAKSGFIQAMYNLGVMYSRGHGVEKSLSKAFYWFKEAANKGDCKAQYNLGVFFFNGYGVEQSFNHAFYWFSMASEMGDEDAMHNLVCMKKRFRSPSPSGNYVGYDGLELSTQELSSTCNKCNEIEEVYKLSTTDYEALKMEMHLCQPMYWYSHSFTNSTLT